MKQFHAIAIVFLATAIAAPPALGRTWFVNVSHALADDAGDGSVEQPFRSIGPASIAAQPGDTIRVAAGVYRERVAPARGGEPGQPIVYEAAARGAAIVRGSDVFTPQWERQDNRGPAAIFRAPLDPSLFAGDNPFHRGISINGEDTSAAVRPAKGELRPVLGEVFVDARPYTQVTTADALQTKEASWMTPAEGGAILVHFPRDTLPAKCQVEITTRDRIFAPLRRGLGNIHVRGFTFEQCANQGPFPQGGAVSVRSGHDWVIEQNIIRFAATIGLDCGGEYWDGAKIPGTAPEDRKLIIGGGHLIRDNDVSDNGLCGIAGWSLRDSRIEYNRVERNNRRQFPHASGGWEEWAGIKLHNSNSLIRGNVVRDNLAFGIWIDNGYSDVRIDSNLLLRNRGAGIFLELGASPDKPCRITNNIIGGTTALAEAFYGGFGIYAHDASDILIAHNLVFDSAGCGLLLRTITDRKTGGKLVESSRSRIVNNLFVNNAGGTLSLPYPNERSAQLASDHNAFWANGPAQAAFAVNQYQGKFKMDDVAQELRRRLLAAGEPNDRLPEPSRWGKDPRLTLDEWRLLMEMDANSVAGEIIVRCDDQALPAQLHMTLDQRVRDLAATPLDGIDQDFRGQPLPKGRALPGPLQGLGAGETTVTLEPAVRTIP